jgi:hypothetical protein
MVRAELAISAGGAGCVVMEHKQVHTVCGYLDFTSPNDWLWIAIYPDRAGDSGTLPAGSEMWLYTWGSQGCSGVFLEEGTLSFGARGAADEWPLTVGSLLPGISGLLRWIQRVRRIINI